MDIFKRLEQLMQISAMLLVALAFLYLAIFFIPILASLGAYALPALAIVAAIFVLAILLTPVYTRFFSWLDKKYPSITGGLSLFALRQKDKSIAGSYQAERLKRESPNAPGGLALIMLFVYLFLYAASQFADDKSMAMTLNLELVAILGATAIATYGWSYVRNAKKI